MKPASTASITDAAPGARAPAASLAEVQWPVYQPQRSSSTRAPATGDTSRQHRATVSLLTVRWRGSQNSRGELSCLKTEQQTSASSDSRSWGRTSPATSPAARATRSPCSTAPPSARRRSSSEHPEAGFVAAETYDEFVASLAKPRTAIIMVQAGKGTDAVISELVERFEPGDIIVDGGNADFHDTIRREAEIAPTGIHFVGTGISGGEEGALNGPSIMPGGSAESYETLGPILASIAAVAEGEPCVTHVGTDGAGHFVKMVHNGIEYADMQLIAEAYDLIRQGTGKSPAEIADIFAEWNTGELESYLIEITAEVLRQTDAETGQPLVDVILDEAGAKGTGAWTVQNALDLGVPVSGIAEAVFARSLSSKPAQREAAVRPARPVGAVDGRPGRRRRLRRRRAQGALRLEDRRLLAGLRRDRRGRRAVRLGHQEGRDRQDLARAAASSAPASSTASPRRTPRTPASSCSLTAPYFRDAIAETQEAWRRVVAIAARAGIPAPAFSSSLAYYDGLRADAPARLARAGPARLLRRAHLQARRQGRACSTRSGRATAPRSRPRPRRTDAGLIGGRRRCANRAGGTRATTPTTASRSRTSARSSRGSARRSRSSRAACCSTSSRAELEPRLAVVVLAIVLAIAAAVLSVVAYTRWRAQRDRDPPRPSPPVQLGAARARGRVPPRPRAVLAVLFVVA